MSNITSLLIEKASEFKAMADIANAIVTGVSTEINSHVKVASSELESVTGDYEYFSDVLMKVASYIGELETKNDDLNQQLEKAAEENINKSTQNQESQSKIIIEKSASVNSRENALVNAGFTREEIEAMGHAPQGTLEKVAHSYTSESPVSMGISSGTPTIGSDPVMDFLFGSN